MAMNGHAKRTIQTLEALDFHLDEDESRRGVHVYWHPNDPEARVKVFAGLSEVAAKKIRNRADQIIGLSSAGERIPDSIGELARVKKESERAKRASREAQEAKRREPFQEAADERAARLRAAADIEAREAQRRELLDLMRPGR